VSHRFLQEAQYLTLLVRENLLERFLEDPGDELIPLVLDQRRDVRSLIDTEELLISPIVEVELQYLFELQRTTQPGSVVVECLEEEIGLARCGLPFPQIVAETLTNGWTRDPFDRIAVAQAQVRRTPLLTRDATIRDHYTEAIGFD